MNNRIEAKGKSVLEVLGNQRYSVNLFHRYYNWGKNHVEQLVTDLSIAFMDNYDRAHERLDVADYNGYYLGPYVLWQKAEDCSIIFGQQRLATLTLLLIHLNDHQQERFCRNNYQKLRPPGLQA